MRLPWRKNEPETEAPGDSPTPTVQSVIKRAASLLHQEHLKPLGFRKSGLNWHRTGKWSHHIGFQLDKWNTSQRAEFRVGYGLFIPEFHAARHRPPIKGTPVVYQCSVSSVLLRDLHHPKLQSWSLVWSENPQTLADSIAKPLLATIPAWFDRLDSWPPVGAELEFQRKFFDAAIVWALAGDRAYAANLLERSLQQMHISARPFAQSVAKELSIPWPENTA